MSNTKTDTINRLLVFSALFFLMGLLGTYSYLSQPNLSDAQRAAKEYFTGSPHVDPNYSMNLLVTTFCFLSGVGLFLVWSKKTQS